MVIKFLCGTLGTFGELDPKYAVRGRLSPYKEKAATTLKEQ